MQSPGYLTILIKKIAMYRFLSSLWRQSVPEGILLSTRNHRVYRGYQVCRARAHADRNPAIREPWHNVVTPRALRFVTMP